MGSGKALGAILVILLLVAAALYASPQLRETARSLVEERLRGGSSEQGAGGTSSPAPGSGSEGAPEHTSTTSSSGVSTTTSQETSSATGETGGASGGGESGTGQPGISLEASASKILYDPVMQYFNLTINVTNTGGSPVTIEDINIAGYSTHNGILSTSPGLPLTLAPGESASLTVETQVDLATLDLFAEYPVIIETSQGNVTVTSETVRAPGWQSGYWNDDFLTLLTDKVFLELGIPEPYEHLLRMYTANTEYGVATTYELVYNITGNILAQVNTTLLLQALEDFMQHNNMSNLTIDSAQANETYLHISASLADSEGYKHAEVTIVYLEDQGITQIITSATEA